MFARFNSAGNIFVEFINSSLLYVYLWKCLSHRIPKTHNFGIRWETWDFLLNDQSTCAFLLCSSHSGRLQCNINVRSKTKLSFSYLESFLREEIHRIPIYLTRFIDHQAVLRYWRCLLVAAQVLSFFPQRKTHLFMHNSSWGASCKKPEVQRTTFTGITNILLWM